MTTLLTLFSISIFGLLSVLGFKVLEMRGMRVSFLPRFVYTREEKIERTLIYAWRKIAWFFTYRARTIAHTLQAKAFYTFGYIRERSRMRMIRALDKKGTASVFLKQVAEHKSNMRNAISYSEIRPK